MASATAVTVQHVKAQYPWVSRRRRLASLCLRVRGPFASQPANLLYRWSKICMLHAVYEKSYTILWVFVDVFLRTLFCIRQA